MTFNDDIRANDHAAAHPYAGQTTPFSTHNLRQRASHSLPRNCLLNLARTIGDGLALMSTIALVVALTVGADTLQWLLL